MPARTELDNSRPKQMIGAVIERLIDGAANVEADAWAGICCASRYCIEACPEGLNPRFMLSMVRRAASEQKTLQERRSNGRAEFKKMARGVRVIARLQMPSRVMERLSPSSRPNAQRPPDVVFPPHFKFAVRKRVALHEHPGSEGVSEAVVAVLSAIPELEVVTLPVPRIGYSLSSLRPIADQRPALLARELAMAQAAGIGVLAGIYHCDHREVVSHHPYWPFSREHFIAMLTANQ